MPDFKMLKKMTGWVLFLFLCAPVCARAIPVSQAHIAITGISAEISGTTVDFGEIGFFEPPFQESDAPQWIFDWSMRANATAFDSSATDESEWFEWNETVSAVAAIPGASGEASASADGQSVTLSSSAEISETASPGTDGTVSADTFLSNILLIPQTDAETPVALAISFEVEQWMSGVVPGNGDFYAELAIFNIDAGLEDDPLYYVRSDEGGMTASGASVLLNPNGLYIVEISTHAGLRISDGNDPVPEPATFLLLVAGITGLMVMRRRS